MQDDTIKDQNKRIQHEKKLDKRAEALRANLLRRKEQTRDKSSSEKG